MSDFQIPKSSKHELELEAQRAAPGDFSRWLAKNPPPELADLIAQHGGYWAIPREAWDAYDQQMAEWQRKLLQRQWEAVP